MRLNCTQFSVCSTFNLNLIFLLTDTCKQAHPSHLRSRCRNHTATASEYTFHSCTGTPYRDRTAGYLQTKPNKAPFPSRVAESPQVNLRHMAESSSLPSLQSLSPSHFQALRMQRPLERHLNSSSGQGSSQCFSSEPSPQSSLPSQIVANVVQLPLVHWNDPGLQVRTGQLSASSDPSPQSFSPSHLVHKRYN